MAGLTERLLSEGRQQGLEQGLRRGREDGERELLIRLLTRRFGALDDQTARRLKAAASTEIERWAENVLEAHTLEDVFAVH